MCKIPLEDQMIKKTARLFTIALLLVTTYNWLYARKAKASPQLIFGQPACRSFVPPEWGEYKDSSEHYGVVFQANDGTLRFITNVPCEATPQIALEIRRGSPSN
jgi:hypothetical protein